MTWFRVGGAGVPVSLKNGMNAVLNKKFGTSGQNYPSNGWPDDVNLLGPLPEKTVAGAIAHTDDAADTVPVKSMICSIVAKQAGTGTPSPSNPRAISGYTGLTLSQAGTNFFNEDWEVGGINDTTGRPNSDTNKIRSKTFFRIVAGLSYYVAAPAPIRVLFYASDESFISETANIRNSVFTAPDNAFYAKMRGTVDYGTTYNFDISINYPATDTIYHAYTTPNNTEDSWSSIGTIYGGERDLVEGTLKKTHEYISSYNGETINEPWISSIDEYVSGTTPSTGAQVVYPLTTPVNYSNLDTYDIETFYAVNNFYTDIVDGQTQVTYRQDIDLALAALQGSRSLSASLMRSGCPDLEERSEDPEEVSETEEDIQNTEEQEGENDER